MYIFYRFILKKKSLILIKNTSIVKKLAISNFYPTHKIHNNYM